MVKLDGITRQKLFGNEAAETEDENRLREYYFKVRSYEDVIVTSPVRILVGHKGTGKSALFRIAVGEHITNGQLAVLIQYSDVVTLSNAESDDFLLSIRNWTIGLNHLIVQKIFELLGVKRKKISELMQDFQDYQGDIVDFLVDSFNDHKEMFSQETVYLIENFLKTNSVFIYIDDLDRGWQGKKENITRISALINAVRDISSKFKNISFKIALRADVYYLVRVSDESADKFEGSVVWHKWNNHEIFVLLIKRIETFLGNSVDEQRLLESSQSDLAKYLNPIMEPYFTGRGKWENIDTYRILMSLIRRRPRDLIKLCTLAATNAYERNSERIETIDFQTIFESYSRGRIDDTIIEYKSELPNIEALLLNMKPSKAERTAKEGYVYRKDKLLEKVNNIKQNHRFTFSNGREATSLELAAFLYKINFITGRKETPKGIQRVYFDEVRYLAASIADFGFDWEIHPAYRWALQPMDIYKILETIEPNIDE